MPIMPLCKYVYEYVTPGDDSCTIKLALDAAFWRTRLYPQKVVLESSRLQSLIILPNMAILRNYVNSSGSNSEY